MGPAGCPRMADLELIERPPVAPNARATWLVNRLCSELEHLADWIAETAGLVGWERRARTEYPALVRQLGELAGAHPPPAPDDKPVGL